MGVMERTLNCAPPFTLARSKACEQDSIWNTTSVPVAELGSLADMTSIIHFERPGFDEIVATIRRIFPVAGGPEFGLSPDSIHRYFDSGGIRLDWKRIPDWSSYEYGQRDISVEEFIGLLFSPRKPAVDEQVLVVTDECFCEAPHKGFSVRFGDLLVFARDVYPTIMRLPMDFFQPSDTIFCAERSKLLVMLHHEGHKMQFVG